jgi:hypothetical protein
MQVPTVTVVTSELAGLGKDTALSQGVVDYPFVVVPHPLGMTPAGEVQKKSEQAFPEILRMAIGWKPETKRLTDKAAYPAERLTLKGSLHDLNRTFFDAGWSLGLPVEPPTASRVAEMLTGTTLAPQTVLGAVPPRMGILTIELVAVHAAMAGCRPQYMPVLIAALEAMLDPRANWRGAATTTGTTAALIIVNGPVVEEICIASTQGAAGADHHANVSIGYAFNLIADVVGGAKSPSPDKSTLGAPSDCVAWVFGENEAALPGGWQPLHMQRGFKKNESVVTFMPTYPPVENIDHWSRTPEEHLTWWAHLVSPLTAVGGPCEVSQIEQVYIIGVGPEHASLVSGKWSQDTFKTKFWEAVRAPLSAWPKHAPHLDVLTSKLGPMKRDTLVPVTMSPEQFLTVIAGGAGKHSHYFAPFPRCSVVSKRVTSGKNADRPKMRAGARERSASSPLRRAR